MRVVVLFWLVISLGGCVLSHDLSVVEDDAETAEDSDKGAMSEGTEDAAVDDKDEISDEASETEGDGKGDDESGGGGTLRAKIDAASDSKRALAKMFAVDEQCEFESVQSVTGAPADLRCTGLYKDLDKRTLGTRMFEYQPASPLWSDGSEKHRYFHLPKGELIDISDFAQWRFPNGTKFFKDFRTTDGRLVETRMFFKKPDGRWGHATYQWNEENTEAKIHLGGPVKGRELAGFTYEIPTSTHCNKCHDGNREHVLGFDAVALGLPSTEEGERRGLTLKQLVEMDMLSSEPEMTELEIGDDGTGLAAPALSFLHTNCGTSCHNETINAQARDSKLWFALNPEELDGRDPVGFDAYTTTIGVPGKTDPGAGWTRLVPGDADNSLIIRLMRMREEKGSMPPLGTKVVDTDHVDQVEAWVKAMPTDIIEPQTLQ